MKLLSCSKSSMAFALHTYQVFFYQQRNQYSLRNSDFVIPCFNTVTNGKHSIKYLGPTLWHRLPRDIRNVTNLNHFKKLIRQKDV